MLIKFLEMSNDPKIPNKDISKEFGMTEGNVTYLQGKLGNFYFKPHDEVLNYIISKTETQIKAHEMNLEFVRTQRAKIIPHDFSKSQGA